MNARLIQNMVELRTYESAWQGLYERIPQASIFTSPTWVLNWLQSFAAPDSLRCVLVFDQDDLQAVLPLVRVATRWRRVPVIALCACTNAHSVRSAWLYRPQRKLAIFAVALQLLRRMGHWDMLLLDGCAGAHTDAALPNLPAAQPITHWCHSSLTISGTWSDYFSGRSRDLRRNLRRTAQGLRAQGVLEFEVLTQDADQLMRHWVVIDRASWKVNAGEVVDSNEQTLGYYQHMLQGFAAKQQLLAGVLLLNRQPIATVICTHDKGVCNTLKTAMRQDFADAKLSTGALVMAHLLEHLWSHPSIRCVDFVSKQPYTDRWTSENLSFTRHLVFALSWRGCLVRVLEASLRRLAPLRRISGFLSQR